MQTASNSGTIFPPKVVQPPLLQPISQVDPKQVLPILQQQEANTKAQIPSIFSSIVKTIPSPTKVFKDYAITGDPKQKVAAGNALTALTNVAKASKTMFTPPAQAPDLLHQPQQVESSSNPLFYNRTQQIAKEVPSTVPVQYQGAVFDNANKFKQNPATLAQILQKESSGNPLAHNQNKDGTVDQGLMQINSANLKQVQQYFQSTGRHFDPLNGNDSIEAAAYLLKENQQELTDKLGRPPTQQELYDSYNLGVSGLVKALQGNTEEKNLLQKYNVGSIFAES